MLTESITHRDINRDALYIGIQNVRYWFISSCYSAIWLESVEGYVIIKLIVTLCILTGLYYKAIYYQHKPKIFNVFLLVAFVVQQYGFYLCIVNNLHMIRLGGNVSAILGIVFLSIGVTGVLMTCFVLLVKLFYWDCNVGSKDSLL